MKRIITVCACLALVLGAFCACGKSGQAISVVSREDGSGTRGAFVELLGIEEKDSDGNKVDHTTDKAEITNSTSVMITTVAGNTNAIGYISLGSLGSDVKAVDIDGAVASAENIKNGTYKVSRPFNIAVKEDISELGLDFILFILSDEGQLVVEASGYISQGAAGPYVGTAPKGKIVISGSSSVTPVMEKLVEAYRVINENAELELQQTDSSSGMTATIDGICDIGMASRELKTSELEAGLVPTVIAMDGIAVIVNNASEIDELSSEQVKAIFTGELTDWTDIG